MNLTIKTSQKLKDTVKHSNYLMMKNFCHNIYIHVLHYIYSYRFLFFLLYGMYMMTFFLSYIRILDIHM